MNSNSFLTPLEIPGKRVSWGRKPIHQIVNLAFSMLSTKKLMQMQGFVVVQLNEIQ
jgi:hypothetical protein